MVIQSIEKNNLMLSVLKSLAFPLFSFWVRMLLVDPHPAMCFLSPLMGWGENGVRKLVGWDKGREIAYYCGQKSWLEGKLIY